MDFNDTDNMDRINYAGNSYAITKRGYTDGVHWVAAEEHVAKGVHRLIYQTDIDHKPHELRYNPATGYNTLMISKIQLLKDKSYKRGA